MKPGPPFAVNCAWHNTLYQQSKNLGCEAHAKGGGTALGAPQALVPLSINHSCCHSSWITAQRPHLPAHRANRHVSPTQTEAFLSLASLGANSHLIFWAVQGGLGCMLGGRDTSAGQEAVIQLLLCQYLPGGSSRRCGIVPMGTHSHSPEEGNQSHEPQRVLTSFSWEHALFF